MVATLILTSNVVSTRALDQSCCPWYMAQNRLHSTTSSSNRTILEQTPPFVVNARSDGTRADLSHLNHTIVTQLTKHETSASVWNFLSSAHAAQSSARAASLRIQLQTMRKGRNSLGNRIYSAGYRNFGSTIGNCADPSILKFQHLIFAQPPPAAFAAYAGVHSPVLIQSSNFPSNQIRQN
ncbi:GRAS domain-containing protein [Psidium guajava]|nr:GRAS domain-containing protein [Psidium guajava]